MRVDLAGSVLGEGLAAGAGQVDPAKDVVLGGRLTTEKGKALDEETEFPGRHAIAVARVVADPHDVLLHIAGTAQEM